MECLEVNGEKARWGLHKNTVLSKILEAKLYKSAALRPLTSYLTNLVSKTNKTCWAWPEKKGRTQTQRSLKYSPTWMCWSTSKGLHISTLCWHWMQSRRPAESDV